VKGKFHTTKQFKAKERRSAMKRLAFIVAMFITLGVASAWAAGDSPGTPGPTMYTLANIYDYLNSGTTATLGGHDLEPPSGAVPGDTRFRTLTEIYSDIKGKFDLCDTTVADVQVGKKFFSTASGSWGVATGTAYPGRLLKTGQTSSYRAGDDGTYSSSKGLAFNLSVGASNTVYDAVTGLQWQAGPEAALAGWNDAIDWANNLVLDGKDDWRLPNITELQSILVRNPAQGDVCINNVLFPYVAVAWYWTSTTVPHNSSLANCVYFGDGLVKDFSKGSSFSFLAVRGGF